MLDLQGGESMNTEIWLLSAIIVILVLFVVYWVLQERYRKRQQEQWENEVYDLYEKLLKKMDQLSSQLMQKMSEESNRLDENTQKRHNYLKKTYNDIADRLDLVEQTEKRTKDLYYQMERSHTRLSELAALMPKAQQATDKEQEAAPLTPAMDEEVSKVLHYYRQGMTVEEIAQKLGRAIPEIQLTLHIFADQLQ